MNLLRGNAKADYVITGEWSKKAIKEAKNYCDAAVAASSEDRNFTYAPKTERAQGCGLRPLLLERDHRRRRVPRGPESRNPARRRRLIAFLSRPLDVARFGLIYAGAQKNAGPAGLTIVIVRDDLIGQAAKGTPSVMDYKAQADADSMLNTPATYSMYIAGLVFKWIKQQGGLAAMEKQNIEKAKVLYDCLDSSRFFASPVAKEDRSRMNVPFTLKDKSLDDAFLKGAAERDLTQLKGHRSVGGMRASIYNAMPIEGVRKLVSYMKEFESKHG